MNVYFKGKKMLKKPVNRYALPKVIISEVNHEDILEFKIKYEKLGRLDRVAVKKMHYEKENIVFDEVDVNGGLIEVMYKDEHQILLVQAGGKSYSIRGKKIGGKQRKREDRVSQVKIQLELTDGVLDKNEKYRVSQTERELIVNDNIKIYSQIVGKEVKTTKEIYLIKRFLGYRSDLLFYYGFVDNFFKVVGNKTELWKINFQDTKNEKLIEYFKFSINDKLKNDETYLKVYSSDNQNIEEDLTKVKNNFSKLRRALMHFDYGFFEKLFNDEDVGFDLDIMFLNVIIKNLDKLNIDTRKEFIDDEKIKIFGEELSLKHLYGMYAHIAINRVAFNKLINSFMMQDGIENRSLKEYFNKRAKDGVAYEVDIHQNSQYKELYKQHKNLVSKVSALSDGVAIAKMNDEIYTLKEKMKQITKPNSLKRLEHKLRLAFGFIYSEYKDYDDFKNNFNDHIIDGRFVPKDEEGKRRAFDSRELARLQGYYDVTLQNKKPQTKEKLGEVSKKIDSLSLATLIDDDKLLKFILLMFTFMPQELKGEFLGFVKKYYHDTKHIEEDSKDKDKDFADGLSVGLRLKVLDKNIRNLSILKHSLSLQTKYNKKDNYFYEDGNVHGRFFKSLGISHNQEEFSKSVYAPLLKYYSALYKLINDFEIYTLAQYITTEYPTLSKVIDSEKFHLRWDNRSKELVPSDDYVFSTLTNKTYDHEKVKELNFIRNKISHFNSKELFEIPLQGYQMKGKKKLPFFLSKKREEIIDEIELQKDIQKILGYDAINDFNMKMVQLYTKLKVYANKEETIEKMLEEATTPNDFYNVYKVKGVETINKHLLDVIGETEREKFIRIQIEVNNKRVSNENLDKL